jgi:hypothetical protein
MANELTAAPVRVARGARRGDPVLDSGYYMIGLLAVAVFAFWPSYFGKLPARLDPYTHLHAAGMLCWFAFLIAQPMLVRSGRMTLHRVLGKLSYVLVPLILGASLLLAHARFSAMDEATFALAGKFLYLPVFTAAVFAVIYGLAVGTRHKTTLHARFMIATAMTLIDPAVARIIAFRFAPFENELMFQVVGFGLTDLLLVTLIVLERRRKQGRAAFPIALAIFATGHILWFTFAQTETWMTFARWYRELPLT